MSDITIYSFYNNKGGVGKTTLCQNAASLYAKENPKTQVLVIDLCPQANISQFLLGGGHKGYAQNQRLQASASRSNIVGFIDWLLKGNSGFSSIKSSYMIQPCKFNPEIEKNLYLIAGDGFLESLSLALNYAVINPANTNAWPEFMTAIRRLCQLEFLSGDYDDMTVFIDCNPSFSIYTQMGLVSSDYLIVPMMADFSSLEGIKGILMLLYGKYPSVAAQKYAETFVTFHRKISESALPLPQFFEFAFNNYTVKLGAVAAFESVRNELITYTYEQYLADPHIFAAPGINVADRNEWEDIYVSNIKDFHTAGKVSASLGIPVHCLPKKTHYDMPDGEDVHMPTKNYSEALDHVVQFVTKFP